MGNSCCNLEDYEILEESSGTTIPSTSPITTAPSRSTQQNVNYRDNRHVINRSNIIAPKRSTQQNTNYRDCNINRTNIIKPRTSTQPNSNHRDCIINRTNIIEPRTSTQPNSNHRGCIINRTNIIEPRKSTQPNSNYSNDIHIIDQLNIVATRSTEQNKQDYTLATELSNKNKDEKLEKVYTNNRLFNISNPPFKKSVLDSENVYKLEKLDSNSWEYREVEILFFKTNKRFFKIHSIEKVHNPYLLFQYEFKKIELRYKQIQFNEEIMYHGTKKCNIDGICQQNFNWRLNGSSRGCKFGKGVSFSPIAYYATHYGDVTYNKVMIVATVLIGDRCKGDRNMHVPQLGYDTSVNDNQHVFVKYDDNTFYPRFLIHYGGIDEKAGNKKNRNTDQVFDCDNLMWDNLML